jgi:hypothetical protein
MQLIFLYVIIAIFLVTGCQSSQIIATQQVTISPTPPPTDAVETPETSKEAGGFRVTLIYQENGEPVGSKYFYLAEMLPVKGEQEGLFVPVLDQVTAPKDESSENGEISISLVPPKKYILTLLTPLGPIMVVDAKTNKEIIVEVIAGEITDLGTINVVLDPDNFQQ